MKRDTLPAEIIRREINDELVFLDDFPSCRQNVLNRIHHPCHIRRKTAVGVVLAAVLLLLTLSGLAVSFFRGILFLDHEAHGAPYACCTSADRLYVLAKNGLWVYASGQEQAQLLISARELPRFRSPAKVHLAAAEDLLLIDTDARQIWKLQNGSFALFKSYAGTMLDEADDHASAILWQDGMLFVQSDHDGSVCRIDPAACAGTKLPVENTTRIANYKPGKLLVLTYTPQQGTAAVIVDTETGSRQELYQTSGIDLKGLSYAAQTDAIYAYVSGTLSRWDGTKWVPVYSAAVPHLPFFLGVFGNFYVAAGHEGIQFMPLEAPSETETLVIHGIFDSADYDHRFQQAFPGVTIARQRELAFDIETALEAPKAGSNADLLHVRIASDEVEALWRMAEPIVSDALHADAKAMLLVRQDVVFRQGALYAVPSSMIVEAWKTENLPSSSVPNTLLALLEEGRYRIGETTFDGTQEVTRLWQAEAYAVHLLKQALRERNANGLCFTDAAFVDTLEALLSFDASASESITTWYHACVELAGYLQPGGTIPYTLPPTIADSSPARIPAYCTAYILNPASQRKETALRYLEYVAAHRPAWDEALLKPDSACPVLNEWAQQRIKTLNAEETSRIEANPENWDVFESDLRFYKEEVAPYIILDNIQQCSKSEEALLQAVLDCMEGNLSPQECGLLLEILVQ